MKHANDNHSLTFLSVCSGIEAASVAFEPLGWKAVAFSEIEPAPCSVLAHHYPHVPNHGDMTKFKEWPNYGKDGSKPINLVCGGTPCQAFSVAGLRDGLNDPRGNLSLTFLAIVDKYQPEWVLFENVPGILSSASNNGPGPSESEIDLDAGNGPEDGEEVVVDDEFEADESHAFSCFLAGLQELGYGVAYRVIDAQYVRVDGFAGAVPQRRRRVFVVGYLGDFRRAAAVLLEPESLSGNPAPSRKAGQKPAPTLSARTQGGGELGTDFELDGGLVADVAGTMKACAQSGGWSNSIDHAAAGYMVPVTTFDRQSSGEYGTDPIASTVSARDYKSPSDLIVSPEIAATLTRGAESQGKGGYAGRRQEDDVNLVARSVAIRGREDGGTIELGDDVAHALRASQGGGDKAHVLAPVTIHSDAIGRSGEAVTPSADAEGKVRLRNPGIGVIDDGTTYSLMASGQPHAVATEWAVRRLTPVECARLQGFPDDYLSVVLHNGKPLADGPMYKGLGNSWPVNSVRWIGRRIQLVEEIARVLAANDNDNAEMRDAA